MLLPLLYLAAVLAIVTGLILLLVIGLTAAEELREWRERRGARGGR